MKRSQALLAGGTALLLGGGLLGWHLYLDHTEYRPPAVALSHGECRGLLDDPGIAELLGRAPRVFATTEYVPATAEAKPSLHCRISGEDGRSLAADAEFGDVRSGGDSLGAAAFGCSVNGRTEVYRAVLRITAKGRKPFPDGPGRERMGELASGFAKRAAEQQLGCAGGAEQLEAM
ncbi:hypothetical protein ACFU7Y_16220 [Kitasatospora sp. NPDC057542]|uniref:hypothetical protein n=1 Tax=Streptomycetaceae TaxID=2062 RepID=UPI001CCCA57A|nr:hypothetical protein [Streptomyces sp. LS1784]